MKPVELELLCPGGVIAPGRLRRIAAALSRRGIDGLRVSAFQSLLIRTRDGLQRRELEEELSRDESHSIKAAQTNRIFSSAPEAGLAGGRAWLGESVFLELLDRLGRDGERNRAISVSLSDPLHALCPPFAARINFIAAAVAHHWHLCVRPAGSAHVGLANFLLPTYLLADLMRWIRTQPEIDARTSLPDFYERLRIEFSDGALPADPNIERPAAPRPPYEGFHQDRNGSDWLGFFRADTFYPVLLLDELSSLCNRQNIGRIFLTHYHSFIIKNIAPAGAPAWREFVQRHDVNLRHDSAGLFWRLGDSKPESLRLRDTIIANLRAADAGTGGRTFFLGANFAGQDADLAVVPRQARLRRRYSVHGRPGADFLGRLRLLYSGLSERKLLGALRRELQGKRPDGPATGEDDLAPPPANAQAVNETPLFQCPACWTVYDERHGDDHARIKPGVAFADLPATYACPVCAQPREHFQAITGEDPARAARGRTTMELSRT